MTQAMTLRPVAAADKAALTELFEALEGNGDTRFFEFHPLTGEEASRLIGYSGKDVYVVAEEAGSVLAYGLLKGFDEGLAIPSVGLAIRPDARRAGLGRLLMQYLHAIAKRRGAERVRLRVPVEDAPAIALFQSLGYEFGGRSGGNLVASCSLGGAKER